MSQRKPFLEFVKKSFSAISPNALYTAAAHARLLREVAQHNAYVETFNAQPGLPNADTLHYHIEQSDVQQLHAAFLAAIQPLLAAFRGKRTIAIFDVTHEPFYGKSTGDYIQGYRPASGSRGSFAFLVCFLLIGGRRFVADAIPLRRDADLAAEIGAMLDRLAVAGIRVGVTLLDRGIANHSTVLAALAGRGIGYLGLYPKYANVKQLLSEIEGSFLLTPFSVAGVHTALAVVRDGKHDWTWVTNLDFRRFWRYRQVYRKRWNIETGFRVQDEARIRTKSVEIAVRMFIFLAALLLYDIWKALDIMVSFKRFVILGPAVTKIVPGQGIP